MAKEGRFIAAADRRRPIADPGPAATRAAPHTARTVAPAAAHGGEGGHSHGDPRGALPAGRPPAGGGAGSRARRVPQSGPGGPAVADAGRLRRDHAPPGGSGGDGLGRAGLPTVRGAGEPRGSRRPAGRRTPERGTTGAHAGVRAAGFGRGQGRPPGGASSTQQPVPRGAGRGGREPDPGRDAGPAVARDRLGLFAPHRPAIEDVVVGARRDCPGHRRRDEQRAFERACPTSPTPAPPTSPPEPVRSL